MNSQIVDIKGRDLTLAYHPESGEPAVGAALLVSERHPSAVTGDGLVVQVVGHESATYPGDREALLAELLESQIADRHEIVRGEPAMLDLKEIKLAKCKIRAIVQTGRWIPWNGTIPSRNVTVTAVDVDNLIANVLPMNPPHPVRFASYLGRELTFEAEHFDKVNVLVGVKGSGKSHTAKLKLIGLARLGAPCWVFDINREFADLPGADVVRVGENYRLRLDEVGLPFLMAVIDEINPMTEISRGALENQGARFIADERRAQNGFASIDYLIERAEHGDFHSNDMVNLAIETRLKMVKRTGLFADSPGTETLVDRFRRVTADGGYVVFDLAELPVGRLRALTRGLNRRLEAICEQEKRGEGRFPFVFFEEAHFYAAPEEILNLITRGRHLGLTTFFITNSPGQLPEVIFRQLDNLIVTGLAHTADRRVIARCSLTDEDTLESLTVSLGPTEALIVGRVTGNFPLVVNIDPLPDTFPATGQTRSFWGTQKRQAPRRRKAA